MRAVAKKETGFEPAGKMGMGMAFEIESALIGLGGALLGGLISSGTTLLVQRGERKKFRFERAWDLRREAYTQIIGSLDRARAITEHIDSEYSDDPHGWDASENNRRAQAQMVEHFQAARAAFHANRLMLSRAFVTKYEEMNRELGESNHSNLAPPEGAAMAAQAMKRIVPEMEELAARELGVAG